VIRDYQDQVQFVYVYKALAHPETNGYVSPFTLQERIEHAKLAKQKTGTHALWISDSMANEIKHAFGDRPNSEFLFDKSGKLVSKRMWSNPDDLRKDLIEMVGDVDRPTRVEDLKLPLNYESGKVAAGVVDRVKLPGRMQSLKLEPQFEDSEFPFYVKLRVEADDALIRHAKGKMYLGFFLDPIYGVHWNNQMPPLQFEFEKLADVEFSPNAASGPEVEEKADNDPREFLIDVDAGTQVSFKLTVHYVACDDAETFCEQVQQSYLIQLVADPDGGMRRNAGSRGAGMRGDQPGPGQPGPGQSPRGQSSGPMAERMKAADRNQDGKISRAEAPPRLAEMFDRFDSDADGLLDESEISEMIRQMQQRRGR
jgi:hypothetical protein